jgi:tRNA-splicing ligase RtcB (3'-phosphate/5'-hydroxy nucleic acid ligase)
MSELAVFTPEGMEPDEGAIKQIQTCLQAGEGVQAVLCADHHLGYSQPIGGAVAYTDYISPSGVGYDIGCGNKAVATNLFLGDVSGEMPKIMDEIVRRISFGMGRPNNEPVDHPIFDRINRDSPMPGVRKLLGNARAQLGTVGSGNHYVDIFAEERTDRIWIGVHFGSRGFGHKIASGFLALAEGKGFDERASEGEMHSPPVLLHIDSPLGHNYIEAMNLAGEYAYAGRDVVCNKVLEIMGAQPMMEVHNHHNFAWLEETAHGTAWVIRKGCTPLWPGQEGFVGGSMGENAVIIRGVTRGDLSDGLPRGEVALWSAPHGAGRVMSRTEAKGKSRKRVTCNHCGYTQQPGEGAFVTCPECMHADISKQWVLEREGKVDWKAAQKKLKRQGIELRGGDADEAPDAYKRLPEVLKAHEEYVEVIHQLRPIGVAMAGSHVKDPYKD